jgi:hypothetical protein
LRLRDDEGIAPAIIISNERSSFDETTSDDACSGAGADADDARS